jgi:TetR/AcrR family transcriptional repressor of nem operon
MAHATPQKLLETGIELLLRHGYNDLGIAALLESTGTPKGSFYHHFASKEDFALQVIDLYMQDVHAGLAQCLGDPAHSPLERIRRFFEASEEKYRQQGYMGCLLGGLGQELSGISEVFRRKVEECLQDIAEQLAGCLREAIAQHELPPGVDPDKLAELLVNCWEGAALRTRLRRDPAPLKDMLDFYFAAATAGIHTEN